MSPFIGSFSGSRSFGRGGGGATLQVYATDNSFSLISGSAGSPTAIYERAYTSVGSYTLPAPPIPMSTQILVIGGGGSGAGGGLGGGGGAGGIVYHPSFSISTAQSISVGGGAPNPGATRSTQPGSNSSFANLQGNGGGRGGCWSEEPGQPGGSGGGSNGHWGGYYGGGPSNQQGYPGATTYGNRGGQKNETNTYVGAGGGGAGQAGYTYGGNGITILGRSVGGGGGGGTHHGWGYYPPSYGGSGGGGPGTQWFYGDSTPGSPNTGGGGGSSHHSPDTTGGAGGSGLVIVRFRGDGLTI